MPTPEDCQNALNVALKKFKETRHSIEHASSSQKMLAESLLKWSLQENNRAIKDVTFQLNELVQLWGDSQSIFATTLGHVAKHLDHVNESYKAVKIVDRQVERYLLKEKKLKHALKHAPKWKKGGDLRLMEQKLEQTVSARQSAERQCAKTRCEQEYAKMCRVKTAMMKLAESYMNMAASCELIFEAHHDISLNMPIPTNDDMSINDIMYTGGAYSRDRVEMARAELGALDLSSTSSYSNGSAGSASNNSSRQQRYPRRSNDSAASRLIMEPPPPYHH